MFLSALCVSYSYVSFNNLLKLVHFQGADLRYKNVFPYFPNSPQHSKNSTYTAWTKIKGCSYHDLSHYLSSEGSWEVAERNAWVSGKLEWQSPLGNCVIFSFETGNHCKQAQGVHLHLCKCALTKTLMQQKENYLFYLSRGMNLIYTGVSCW